MSETATILVEDTSTKSGTSAKGNAWTKHGIKDGNGNWYSTFDGALIPSDIKGKRATIEFEVDGKFKNLVSLTVEQENGLPRAEKADGSPDWDLKGLHMTRTALWRGFLQGDACQSLIALFLKDNPDIKPSGIAHNLLAIGRNLVRGAEVDIYHREPAQKEDEVPF